MQVLLHHYQIDTFGMCTARDCNSLVAYSAILAFVLLFRLFVELKSLLTTVLKVGIEAHLMKEELSEWNEYSKQILYRMDIAPTGGNRGAGQRGDRSTSLYSSSLLINS